MNVEGSDGDLPTSSFDIHYSIFIILPDPERKVNAVSDTPRKYDLDESGDIGFSDFIRKCHARNAIYDLRPVNQS